MATKPALDYDLRYGNGNGAWTSAMFIEAVYRELKQRKGSRVMRVRELHRRGRPAPPCAARSRARVCRVHRRKRVLGAAPGKQRAAAAPRRRPGRPYRLLGGRRQRRLAPSDGDPAKGDFESLPLNAGGRKRAPMRGILAEDDARAAVQGVRRRRHHRQPGRVHITWQDDNDAEDRFRRRHANAAAELRSGETAAGREDMAGLLVRRVAGPPAWGAAPGRRRDARCSRRGARRRRSAASAAVRRPAAP